MVDKQLIGNTMSRRGLLAGVAVTTAGVSAVAPFTAGRAAGAEPAPSSSPDLPLATFSAGERDRRWAAVREIMAQPQWNLDAIVAGSPTTDAGGDNLPVGFDRYLTQVGGAEDGGAYGPVVFPRAASEPVDLIVQDDGSIDFWNARGLDQWTADGGLAISAGDAVPAVAARLSALGATRVGIAELGGTRFNPLGFVPARYLDALRAALPGVEFVGIENWEVDPADPGPLAASAMVKGPEEQAVARACTRASEGAIDAILSAVRHGAKRQVDLWYAAYFGMFEQTGEQPTRLSIGLDIPGNATFGAPTGDLLSRGQIISEEISARVQGYGAQVNHSIFVGNTRTPGYDYYEAAVTVAIQAIEDAIAFINANPGSTTGELITDYAEKAQARGAAPPGGVVVHTDGIGSLSRPRLGTSQLGTGQDDNIVIVPGMAFDFKPNLSMRRDVIQDVGATNRRVQVGENILVTEGGAVRLGTRKLVPLLTH
ncbi:MAG: M24 family metallopeptidase [Nocardioides sp.]|nr:M24 family metallopeptidase [Nocardioides sp.]